MAGEALLGLAVASIALAKPLPSSLEKPKEIFESVFAQLPAEVEVMPTEHYFYWRGTSDGKEVRGNFRFANGLRERGILSVGYGWDGEKRSGFLDKEHGISLTCADAFTMKVQFAGKEVTFHLNQLPQTPPTTFALTEDEVFVERTCDESGLHFFLLYHKARNHFLWVLDDSIGRGNFTSLAPEIEVEKESGFVFWHQGNRRALAAVSKASIEKNDYFDGPFDQLADNHAEKSGRKALMEKAIPECAGKIDALGNYIDSPKPRRVGLVPYWQYDSLDEAKAFVSKALESRDPNEYIARLGQLR